MKKSYWKRWLAIVLAGALLGGCGSKAGEESTGGGSSAEMVVASQNAGDFVDAALAEASKSAEVAAQPKEDWSKKYENYFEEHPLDNSVMDVEYEEQGLKTHIQMGFCRTDEMLYMKYAIWAGKEGTEFDLSQEKDYLIAYFQKSGDAYVKTVMPGKKDECYRTTGMPWENAEEISESGNPLELGDDTFDGITYDSEETIDGVVYDVLFSKTIRQTASKANRYVKTYFYINRETQELELIRVKDGTKVMDCHMTPINPESVAEIPADLLSGKKVKSEEFGMNFAIAIVKISFHSMGLDPDQLDWNELAGLQ